MNSGAQGCVLMQAAYLKTMTWELASCERMERLHREVPSDSRRQAPLSATSTSLNPCQGSAKIWQSLVVNKQRLDTGCSMAITALHAVSRCGLPGIST